MATTHVGHGPTKLEDLPESGPTAPVLGLVIRIWWSGSGQ